MGKYEVTIGLQNHEDSITRIIEAGSMKQAEQLAEGMAVVEFCYVDVQPIDEQSELEAILSQAQGSVRQLIRTLAGYGEPTPMNLSRAKQFNDALHQWFVDYAKQVKP